jgi:hypothetical protein
MSITAVVRQFIHFTGDQQSELIWDSGNLEDSPYVNQLVNLITGDNELEVPVITDFVVHGVAIVPPAANVIEPILKGAALDTGLSLSASQVSLLQFGETVPTSIFLEVDADVDALRLVWF